MSLSVPPLNSRLPVLNAKGETIAYAGWSQPWGNYLSESWQVAFDVQNSGVTGARPTKNLYTGKPYFDTTLGRPIWWNGAAWIKADGTVV